VIQAREIGTSASEMGMRAAKEVIFQRTKAGSQMKCWSFFKTKLM
jgi:hypothetical protein